MAGDESEFEDGDVRTARAIARDARKFHAEMHRDHMAAAEQESAATRRTAVRMHVLDRATGVAIALIAAAAAIGVALIVAAAFGRPA